MVRDMAGRLVVGYCPCLMLCILYILSFCVATRGRQEGSLLSHRARCAHARARAALFSPQKCLSCVVVCLVVFGDIFRSVSLLWPRPRLRGARPQWAVIKTTQIGPRCAISELKERRKAARPSPTNAATQDAAPAVRVARRACFLCAKRAPPPEKAAARPPATKKKKPRPKTVLLHPTCPRALSDAPTSTAMALPKSLWLPPTALG